MNNDTMNAIKKFTTDMSKAPAPKQLAVGATAGWLAGYMTMKVGKAAATLVGGSLLVLQIAHHKGNLLKNAVPRKKTKCFLKINDAIIPGLVALLTNINISRICKSKLATII